jgi:hypothetical protein
MIAHFYVESGLDSELWGTNLDKDGNLIGSEKKIEYFDGLVIKEITEAQESARQYLTDHQGLVRFLTAQLVKKQSLTGEDFETLIKYYKGNKLSSIEQELLKDRFNKSNWSANTQVPSDKVSLEKINPEQMQCKVIFK